MNRNFLILYPAVAGLIAVLCAMPSTAVAEPPAVELDDLWEDTPATKDLPHVWRIYRRRQLPHRLHEQLRLTDLNTKWGGSFGDKAMSLSPLHHVSKETPPTLLIHGDADECVDIEHSRAFCVRMSQLKRPSKLVVLEGAGHAFAVFKYGPDRFVKRTIVEIDNYLVDLGWLPGRRS